MPKRLSIHPHLSVEELEHRYRHAKDVTARSHYQIFWLLSRGKTSEEVVAVTGYSRHWVYELVRSYNRLGAEAIGDLRRHNRGETPQLDDVQQANLW
jgi:transposase